MTDPQLLLDAKTRDYDELAEQYAELEEQTNLIINDLEEELQQTRRKNEQLAREITEQKEKAKCFKSSIEREVDLAQKERNEFKKKFIIFEKKVIELEIVNESLESELRATKSRLFEYESQTEKTMEELAIAQIELQETQESNKETVARLRGQLKEAEEELFVLQKHKEVPRTECPGQPQVGTSEVAQKQVFRETLKGIRDYLEGLDARKLEARKTLLKMCSQ